MFRLISLNPEREMAQILTDQQQAHQDHTSISTLGRLLARSPFSDVRFASCSLPCKGASHLIFLHELACALSLQ